MGVIYTVHILVSLYWGFNLMEGASRSRRFWGPMIATHSKSKARTRSRPPSVTPNTVCSRPTGVCRLKCTCISCHPSSSSSCLGSHSMFPSHWCCRGPFRKELGSRFQFAPLLPWQTSAPLAVFGVWSIMALSRAESSLSEYWMFEFGFELKALFSLGSLNFYQVLKLRLDWA